MLVKYVFPAFLDLLGIAGEQTNCIYCATSYCQVAGFDICCPIVMQKASHMQRKDGSTVRPKGSMLEKAIRELEKMVAECMF